MRRNVLFAAVALLVTVAIESHAATLVVSTTNDVGPGSFRQALLDANVAPDADTIVFSIGAGHQIITPASPLPPLLGPLVVDGSTQPGYTGTPLIEIYGAGGDASCCGLRVTGDVTIRGLIVNGNSLPDQTGIFVQGEGKVSIGNCYVGIDVTGTQARGNHRGVFVDFYWNASSAVVVSDSVISGNTIGVEARRGLLIRNRIGTNAAGNAAVANTTGVIGAQSTPIGEFGQGNVISGNVVGVDSWGSVRGNRIGTAADGDYGVPNGHGVLARGGVIEGNVIAFNTGDAVRAEPGERNDVGIHANSMYANGFGINLVDGPGDSGPTPNDPGDTDVGPNRLLNYPPLTGAVSNGTSTVVEGAFEAPLESRLHVEFFSSPQCHPSGFGEGKAYVGSMRNIVEVATTSYVIPAAVPPGSVITAVAQINDPDGSGTLGEWHLTSEFSNCVTVAAGPRYQPRVRSDFDGNGTADIFWHNSATGETRIWGMWGLGQSSGAVGRWYEIAGYTMQSLDWKPMGIADFNKDGRDDIVWRNMATGANQIWFLNPYVYDVQWITGAYADPRLRFLLQAVGDFDGDGDGDLLWSYRDDLNRQLYSVWFMAGATVQSIRRVSLPQDVQPRWGPYVSGNAIGSADFNGDGRHDVFLDAGSDKHIMFMRQGVERIDSFSLGVDAARVGVVAVADFDVDFKADVLMRDPQGRTQIKFMSAEEVRYSSYSSSISLAYRVAAVGDFNGDGASDIAWRNPDSGDNQIWLMNGPDATPRAIPSMSGSSWQMVMPH